MDGGTRIYGTDRCEILICKIFRCGYTQKATRGQGRIIVSGKSYSTDFVIRDIFCSCTHFPVCSQLFTTPQKSPESWKFSRPAVLWRGLSVVVLSLSVGLLIDNAVADRGII